MFCPKCSEKQISNEIRFCSRCGFSLADVAEALENDGVVERNVIQSEKNLKSTTVKGVSIMSVGGIFLLLSLIIGTPEPSYFVQFNLLVGILTFLFGMGFISYNFWVKPKRLENESQEVKSNSIESKVAEENFLKEPDLSNVADYAPPKKNYTTKELAQPISVTENTTKNLKVDDN